MVFGGLCFSPTVRHAFITSLEIGVAHRSSSCGRGMLCDRLTSPLTRNVPYRVTLQLFMVPEFREGVLGFRDSEQTPSEDSVMWQLQNMFSHLQVRTGPAAAAASQPLLCHVETL